LIGINGAYTYAMKELCSLLMERTPPGTTPVDHQQLDSPLVKNDELIEGIRSLESIPITSSSPETERSNETPLEIFISSVPEDEKLGEELTKHLSALKHQGIISIWHYRSIIPGAYRPSEVDRHLNSSAVILLLVSSDFNASEYIRGVELERAIELHKKEKAWVIPVLLRPVDWKGTPFEFLKPLPTNGAPVTLWPNSDSAFVDIVQGIRHVIDELKKKV